MATRKPTTNKIIHDDLGWIKNKLSEIDVDMKLLKQTVVGNKEYGQKGLVEQTNEHRKYIDADKNLKAKFIGGTTAVGVIWTLLLKFWDRIFT